VMFAPFFIPLIAYGIYLAFGEKRTARWSLAILLAAGFVILLWGFSWLLSLGVKFADPVIAGQYLQSQGVANIGALFAGAISRRLSYIGGLLTLLLLLIPALAFLLANHKTIPDEDRSPSATNHQPSTINHQPSTSPCH